MKKVVELLNNARAGIAEAQDFFSRETIKDMLIVVDGLIDQALEELNTPRWETPEQWEKRTGKPWPDNGAVYWRMRDNNETKWLPWFPVSLEMAEFATVKTVGEHQIVCATEAGPPPDDWRPAAV